MKVKTRLPSPSLTLLRRKVAASKPYPSSGSDKKSELSEPAEGITHRDSVLRHDVSSVFLIHVVDPVKIKLWLDENVRFHVNLYAHCAVQLKVIGAREVGTLVIAHRGGGAS